MAETYTGLSEQGIEQNKQLATRRLPTLVPDSQEPMAWGHPQALKLRQDLEQTLPLDPEDPSTGWGKRRTVIDKYLDMYHSGLEPAHKERFRSAVGVGDEQQRHDFFRTKTPVVGTLARAAEVGVNALGMLKDSMDGWYAIATDDPEMLLSNIRELDITQRENQAIYEYEFGGKPGDASFLHKFLFDAVATIPAMSVAIGGAAMTSKALAAMGVTGWLGSILGMGTIDALMEAGYNWADVVTDPVLRKKLEDKLGRLDNATIDNLGEMVKKEIADHAGDPALATGLTQFFLPTNHPRFNSAKGYAPARGAKGGRAGMLWGLWNIIKTTGLREGVEEALQSGVSQTYKEAAARRIADNASPDDAFATRVPGAAADVWTDPEALKQMAYEGAIGTVAGTVVGTPGYARARKKYRLGEGQLRNTVRTLADNDNYADLDRLMMEIGSDALALQTIQSELKDMKLGRDPIGQGIEEGTKDLRKKFASKFKMGTHVTEPIPIEDLGDAGKDEQGQILRDPIGIRNLITDESVLSIYNRVVAKTRLKTETPEDVLTKEIIERQPTLSLKVLRDQLAYERISNKQQRQAKGEPAPEAGTQERGASERTPSRVTSLNPELGETGTVTLDDGSTIVDTEVAPEVAPAAAGTAEAKPAAPKKSYPAPSITESLPVFRADGKRSPGHPDAGKRAFHFIKEMVNHFMANKHGAGVLSDMLQRKNKNNPIPGSLLTMKGLNQVIENRIKELSNQKGRATMQVLSQKTDADGKYERKTTQIITNAEMVQIAHDVAKTLGLDTTIKDVTPSPEQVIREGAPAPTGMFGGVETVVSEAAPEAILPKEEAIEYISNLGQLGRQATPESQRLMATNIYNIIAKDNPQGLTENIIDKWATGEDVRRGEMDRGRVLENLNDHINTKKTSKKGNNISRWFERAPKDKLPLDSSTVYVQNIIEALFPEGKASITSAELKNAKTALSRLMGGGITEETFGRIEAEDQARVDSRIDYIRKTIADPASTKGTGEPTIKQQDVGPDVIATPYDQAAGESLPVRESVHGPLIIESQPHQNKLVMIGVGGEQATEGGKGRPSRGQVWQYIGRAKDGGNIFRLITFDKAGTPVQDRQAARLGKTARGTEADFYEDISTNQEGKEGNLAKRMFAFLSMSEEEMANRPDKTVMFYKPGQDQAAVDNQILSAVREGKVETEEQKGAFFRQRNKDELSEIASQIRKKQVEVSEIKGKIEQDEKMLGAGKLQPMEWNRTAKQGVDTGGAAKGTDTIIELDGRKVVMLDMFGLRLPFYLSSGLGGKTNVDVGKWYPMLGIDSVDGWFNKTSEGMKSYYGSDVLKQMSEFLDNTVGDIRDVDTHPRVTGVSADSAMDHTDTINGVLAQRIGITPVQNANPQAKADSPMHPDNVRAAVQANAEKLRAYAEANAKVTEQDPGRQKMLQENRQAMEKAQQELRDLEDSKTEGIIDQTPIANEEAKKQGYTDWMDWKAKDPSAFEEWRGIQAGETTITTRPALREPGRKRYLTPQGKMRKELKKHLKKSGALIENLEKDFNEAREVDKMGDEQASQYALDKNSAALGDLSAAFLQEHGDISSYIQSQEPAVKGVKPTGTKNIRYLSYAKEEGATQGTFVMRFDPGNSFNYQDGVDTLESMGMGVISSSEIGGKIFYLISAFPDKNKQIALTDSDYVTDKPPLTDKELESLGFLNESQKVDGKYRDNTIEAARETARVYARNLFDQVAGEVVRGGPGKKATTRIGGPQASMNPWQVFLKSMEDDTTGLGDQAADVVDSIKMPERLQQIILEKGDVVDEMDARHLMSNNNEVFGLKSIERAGDRMAVVNVMLESQKLPKYMPNGEDGYRLFDLYVAATLINDPKIGAQLFNRVKKKLGPYPKFADEKSGMEYIGNLLLSIGNMHESLNDHDQGFMQDIAASLVGFLAEPGNQQWRSYKREVDEIKERSEGSSIWGNIFTDASGEQKKTLTWISTHQRVGESMKGKGGAYLGIDTDRGEQNAIGMLKVALDERLGKKGAAVNEMGSAYRSNTFLFRFLRDNDGIKSMPRVMRIEIEPGRQSVDPDSFSEIDGMRNDSPVVYRPKWSKDKAAYLKLATKIINEYQSHTGAALTPEAKAVGFNSVVDSNGIPSDTPTITPTDFVLGMKEVDGFKDTHARELAQGGHGDVLAMFDNDWPSSLQFDAYVGNVIDDAWNLPDPRKAKRALVSIYRNAVEKWLSSKIQRAKKIEELRELNSNFEKAGTILVKKQRETLSALIDQRAESFEAAFKEDDIKKKILR